MSADGELFSGIWWNKVFADAFEVVEPIIREIGNVYMDGGYAAGHEPVTLKTLEGLPDEQTAQQVVRQMIMQPYYREQGFKVLGQIMERMNPEPVAADMGGA